MADSTDRKAAYLAGILDGFRLARAQTQVEAENLIAEISKADIEARIRAALAYRGELDTDERDPTSWLN